MDETMSDAIAFTGENKTDGDDGVFKFDPVKEETPTASQAESKQYENAEDTTSSSSEEKKDVVDEQRVPYSRFKSKVEELEQRDELIANLESRLSTLETQRSEQTPLDELTVPTEWVELYGDSDVSKRAYKIQLQRDEQIQENAIRKALDMFREETTQQESQLQENESIIDSNLSSLQESLGKQLTPKQEEEVLSIVDEFSPTGDDGKYISLFPFDKAYEIYELRNQKVSRSTNKARNEVANLTGNTSEGEAESSDSSFTRGWDNWRKEL